MKPGRFTTGANNLHKAHVKYLEARLVEIARQVGRMALENGTTPVRASLSEAAVANMEAFLDYLLIVLPALRVDMFLEYAKPSRTTETEAHPAASPVFALINKKRGLRATATLVDGDFIVEAGSTANPNWVGKGTEESGYAQLHGELLSTGVLRPEGQHCVFTKSYAFRSPSAAAAVVHGRNANGTTAWKIEGTGETYKQWEAAQLDATDEVAA